MGTEADTILSYPDWKRYPDLRAPGKLKYGIMTVFVKGTWKNLATVPQMQLQQGNQGP